VVHHLPLHARALLLHLPLHSRPQVDYSMFSVCALNVPWICALNSLWMCPERPVVHCLPVHARLLLFRLTLRSWLQADYSMFPECSLNSPGMLWTEFLLWYVCPEKLALLFVPECLPLNVCPWMFHECSLNTPWMCPECALNVPRICSLNDPWMWP
jgi:hypothetical protein